MGSTPMCSSILLGVLGTEGFFFGGFLAIFGRKQGKTAAQGKFHVYFLSGTCLTLVGSISIRFVWRIIEIRVSTLVIWAGHFARVDLLTVRRLNVSLPSPLAFPVFTPPKPLRNHFNAQQRYRPRRVPCMRLR